MATVEQCDSQATGLPNISNTLKLFDTFKASQEDEKDSDEESFHLPMLDCDDDLESNTKTIVSETNKEIQNGETEDDILNRFDTNGTPDIDPKIEEKLLLEIDNLLEKKPDESNTETDNDVNKKDIPPTSEEGLDSRADNKNQPSDSNIDEKEPNINENEIIIDSKHQKLESKENVESENELEDDKTVNPNENVTTKKDKEDKKIEDKQTVTEHSEDHSQEQKFVSENMDVSIENSAITEERESDKNITSSSAATETVLSDSIHDNKELVNAVIDEGSISKVETEKEEDTTPGIDNQGSCNEDSLENETNTADDETLEEKGIEAMEVDINAKENINNKSEEMSVDDQIEKEVSSDNNFCEMSNSSTLEEMNDCAKVRENTDKVIKMSIINKSMESVDEDTNSQNIPSENGTQTNVDTEKSENSNDSIKSQNLDSDDLLDISVIRDVDEDNASAIAENANDAPASERSDNDNDDQDEGSDKAETELDESEMDQEDTLLATDKEDVHMEFEDDGSTLADQDNVISGNTSDSDNTSSAEIKESEPALKDSNSILKDISEVNITEVTSELNVTEVTSENIQTDEVRSNSTALDKEIQDSVRDSSSKTGGKRSLTVDVAESPMKKIKLSERSKTEENVSAYKNNKIKTLDSFEKYMQMKTLEKKLTRSDLEQFCLQKICEAIIHKTDVGELHQTIKKQELIIDNLRKDLQQLTKQARDLDIVNKKLMSELRIQNGLKKPLVPLKITRSVGLQVKLNPTPENITRRKPQVVTTPRTPTTNNNTNAAARPKAITPANVGVVRQVAPSPRKTPTPSPAPTTTPLLSQALQNRQATPAPVTKRQPIRPKPAEPSKPPNSGVIDLTDEDDKATKGAVKTNNKTISLTPGKKINIIPTKTVPNKTVNSNQNKTVTAGQAKTTNVGAKVTTPTRTVATLPAGVRLPQQVKGGSIAIPASVVTSNAGTTQFMYVVQPGPVVTSTAGGTQKAVLLNFQPTNGVLTSALNGSAVSVLPSKAANTVQLKTVAPRKHPAPLPTPPSLPLNPTLKPLLPKPHLSIRKTDTGIILQWRMPYNLDIYEAIASYQLFAYQETSAAPSTDMWRKVGDVKALALPMACTLTQFADKNKYYFAVRSVDVHKRIGAFSDPEEISL